MKNEKYTTGKTKKVLKITFSEIKLTFGGFSRFYIEYFKALSNIRLHPLAIADWLMMVLFLLILFLHPFFPPLFKLLSSIFVIYISYQKTKMFVKNAKYQPQKQHARIRGGILALFPFYLVAVTTFIWGLWEVWPGNNFQEHYVRVKNEQTNNQEPDKTQKSLKNRKIHPGVIIVDDSGSELKVIYEQTGNPLLNVLNDAYPGKTPRNMEFIPEYDNALSFWIYSLKVTLRINLAGITEFVHNAFVVDEDKLYITRLDGWHEFMLVLEVILQTITSILFLGIIADIALSVQRKIQTGEIDIDFSRDYAIELLKSVKELDTIAEIDYTVESWDRLKKIQLRAVENLIEKIQLEYPDSSDKGEKYFQLRNNIITTKVASVLTLSNFYANSQEIDTSIETGTTEEIIQDILTLTTDESLRVRCAAIIALSKIDIMQIAENLADLIDTTDEIQKLTVFRIIESYAISKIQGEAIFEKGDEFFENIQNRLITSLDSNPDIIMSILNILRHYPRQKLLQKLITEFETCKNESLKVGIIHAYGVLHYDETLIDIFHDIINKDDFTNDKSLLFACLKALGLIDITPVKKEILNLAKNNDIDVEIRKQAVLALGISEIDIFDYLIEFLNEPEIADSALISLVAMFNSSIAEKLIITEDFFIKLKDVISSDDEYIRNLACLTLAKTKDLRAYEILVDMLPNPNAAIALGILGNPDAVPELVKTANKTVNKSKFSFELIAPIEALSFFGISGLKALENLYNKRRKDRETIARVIAKINLPESVTFLLKKFHPESLESCKILAPALAYTRDDRVKRPLLNAVKQNPDAAGVITHALLGFEDEKMVEEILDLISAFNDEIRNEVFNTFKFYRPKKNNIEVFSSIQRYFEVFSSKAEGWAKRLNKVLRKHPTILQQKSRPEKNTEKIDINALDEFD